MNENEEPINSVRWRIAMLNRLDERAAYKAHASRVTPLPRGYYRPGGPDKTASLLIESAVRRACWRDNEYRALAA